MIHPLTADALEECISLYVDTFNAPPWNESWNAGDAAPRLGDFLATPRAIGVWLQDPDGSALGFALGHLERSGNEDHFLLQADVRPSERATHGAWHSAARSAHPAVGGRSALVPADCA